MSISYIFSKSSKKGALSPISGQQDCKGMQESQHMGAREQENMQEGALPCSLIRGLQEGKRALSREVALGSGANSVYACWLNIIA